MASTKFNYIIVGAGAAGLQLALAMLDDAFFSSKQILLLDKDEKDSNDRTWCFWEKGQGKWDKLLLQSWNQGLVVAKGERIPLDLNAYNYKMLRSSDFYRLAKSKIKASKNITWRTENVTKVKQKDNLAKVKTTQNKYSADYVFDSRIPKSFKLEHLRHLNIAQHFKGWMIDTQRPVFDEKRFTMMDFSIKDGLSTSFTYVLPISPCKALVEFTYFTPKLVDENVYDNFLKKYISEKLDIQDYKIIEEEQGIIPMTNFPFSNFSSPNIIKIGTAGGWVKASSGYSFKNCERESQKIISALKHPKNTRYNFNQNRGSRFHHYDKLFLDVLSKSNAFGEELFYRMYKKNNIETIFRFLDETSSLKEEIGIIISLNSRAFIKAFVKHARNKFKT